MTQAMKYYRTGADKGNSDCRTGVGIFYQAGERIPGGVKIHRQAKRNSV
jgi:hypothetical protein